MKSRLGETCYCRIIIRSIEYSHGLRVVEGDRTIVVCDSKNASVFRLIN